MFDHRGNPPRDSGIHTFFSLSQCRAPFVVATSATVDDHLKPNQTCPSETTQRLCDDRFHQSISPSISPSLPLTLFLPVPFYRPPSIANNRSTLLFCMFYYCSSPHTINIIIITCITSTNADAIQASIRHRFRIPIKIQGESYPGIRQRRRRTKSIDSVNSVRSEE